MAKKLSRYFGVSATNLKKLGVFNAFIGIDNKLFVDPTLLRNAKTSDFKDARTKLEGYFENVIKLLRLSRRRGDVAYQEAARRLVFREETALALGYANAGCHGNAIGAELGERLLERADEIVKLGIDDPVIFELIGLFEEDFGADRLSDMTVAILTEEFRAYTHRVAVELDLTPRAAFRFDGKDYELPIAADGKSPLLLAPEELLDTLPLAVDPSGIDAAAAFNAELRNRFNALFAAAAKAKRKVTKAEIREVFFTTRGGIESLVRMYREQTGKRYDFDADPLGLFDWDEIGSDIAKQYPLDLPIKAPKNIKEVRAIVDTIIKQFKKNIEQNRLNEVLYDESGNPRKEVYSQRLFYSVADSYCEANDADLSREPNAGNGPVDFKVSSGYNGRVLVEIKLSSNTHLVKGFTAQLPAYEKSEATQESALVILRVTESEAAIKELYTIRQQAIKRGGKVPDVVVIDARPTPPGSKR